MSNPLCFNEQWIPNDPFQTYKSYVQVPACRPRWPECREAPS